MSHRNKSNSLSCLCHRSTNNAPSPLASELAEATQLRKSLTEKLEAIDRLPAALLAQAFQGAGERM